MRPEHCAWRRCRCQLIELTYLKRPLCLKHWLRLCQIQADGRNAEARRLIGLPRRAVKPVAQHHQPLEPATGVAHEDP